MPKKPSLESHTRSDYLGMSLFHVLLSRTWSAKAKGGKGRKNEFFPPSLLWHGGALLHRQTHNTHTMMPLRDDASIERDNSPRAQVSIPQPNAPLIIPRTMPHRRRRSLDPPSSAPSDCSSTLNRVYDLLLREMRKKSNPVATTECTNSNASCTHKLKEGGLRSVPFRFPHFSLFFPRSTCN